MTTLGSIEFDNRILDALRDDSLVVFAGAGVSMGPPSSLPDFLNLTRSIAQGKEFDPNMPLDRVLGRLHLDNVDVHGLAERFLSLPESAPNALHRDLLRMFRTVGRVRLVTTNFDTHFETAANDLFGSVPDVYKAPALPLGYDFSGIVHVHGALPRSRDLVLTDSNFGRAYLTEGWARRFLVELFRQYTVLFVGYSHDDVVMNYLARALPANRLADRFALTYEDGSWKLLGINPIRFVKGEGKDAFKELYDGVHRLADRMSRGELDWQSSLAQLGGRIPPTDPEAISEIEQALREVYTTRFLLAIARGPEWIRWLNGRKYLDKLFSDADLSERDQLLVKWLAQHFVIQHPQVVVKMAAAHGLRMNPELWWAIGCELGSATVKQLDESDLKRLVTVILACAPTHANKHVLKLLAERCASQGCFELALKAFMAMCQYRFDIQSGIAPPDDEDNERRNLVAQCSLPVDHWKLNEVWTKHLKPNLTRIAQPLLSGVTQRIEEMHGHLSAWDRNLSDWDSLSYRRSAIEPNDQDEHPEAIDVLVDSARDALESLATDSPALLGAWIERLVASNVPLLRRLAIHAITVHPEKSPEERLLWLLNRVGLHGHLEHHEVYRAVALNYPDSPDSVRKAVVDAILAHEMPASDDRPAEMRTARSHFDWLSWLLQSNPDCSLAGKALATIKTRYPEWRTSDHPDFTHWMGSVVWEGSVSPWSVEQLLDRELREQLDDLLNFRGVNFGGPSREGLLVNCLEACKQNPKWAFELGWALAERTQWSTDLWPALIQGLQDSEMPEDSWRNLLELVSNPALQTIHTHQIANLLYSLVKDGGKPFSIELFDQANAIAIAIWQISGTAESGVYDGDWLSRAINRPSGVIVEFWLNSLSLIMQGKTSAEREMPESYRTWFTMVIKDTDSRGGFGRTLLASRTAFLFSLDQDWTREHMIPLFRESDQRRFEQAWDGFLMGGRLYPDLVDALLPAFVAAIPRLTGVNHERRRRFIEFFTSIAAFYVTDPTKELLPALFQQGLLEDRSAFASHLGSILRHMQQEAKLRIWNDWLKRFWKDRQLGVYAALDESEIRAMLGWLPHLGDSFPDAVAIAVRSPTIRIEHSRVLYDLHESELVTQYSVETAELLIYLANCGIGHHVGYLQKTYARLTSLPDNVRLKVDEAFARAGVPKIEE